MAVKAKRSKLSVGATVFILVMLAVPVLHFIVFWLYVNFDTVALSFERYDGDTNNFVFNGFGNYVDLFREFTKDDTLLYAVRNSFTLLLWNNFVIVPISLVFAFVMYKKVPFSGFYKVVFFLPSIISVSALTLVFMYMFDANSGFVPGILDSLGLSDKIPFDGYFADAKYAWWMVLFYGLWSGIGYNIVLISGAMTRIPEEIVEAGKLDGLTPLKELWHVTIPLIGSTLGTLMLLGTTVMFTYFLQVKLLLGGNAATTHSYTIALWIVDNVRESGNINTLPIGAAMGVVRAVIGIPVVFGTRKLIDRFLPSYEY